MSLSEYDMECLAKAKSIIDKDYSIHYTIESLAQQVGLGATRLKAGFKLLYNMGIYEYLREQRMQHAMVLVYDKTKTLKQVAKAAGFKHSNNFIVAFCKRFGLSPGAVRKNIL